MTLILTFCFWICIFLVFYTYIGYAALISIMVKIKELFVSACPMKNYREEDFPDVTLFITAYNEENVVAEKMTNIAAIDYPKDRLKIVWVTDGSTDNTNKLLGTYNDITILFEPQRKGKTAAINRGMTFVDTPFVIFSDANSLINPEAIRLMMNKFTNKTVGGVSGEKRISSSISDGITSHGENVYWQYESKLKDMDSRFHSVVGAAGELFAIRRDLFDPIPEDSLLDDFILSMRIAKKGFCIAYTKDAYAIERGTINIKEEQKRKTRISAGGWQSVFRLYELLDIFRYGKLSFQYISHRVLRWTITPFALFLLLPVSFILYITGESLCTFYGFIFFTQVFCYLLAYCGYIFQKKNIRKKIFYIPYYFVFMNTSVFYGLIYLLRNKGTGVWEKATRY